MKRKTKEEYSEAETGDCKTLFYQGFAISNPNKSKEDWNRKVLDMEEKEGLLPQLVQNKPSSLVNGVSVLY